MRHDKLGEITRDNGSGDGVAHVSFADRTIQIRIIEDEISFEATLDVAAAVVQHLNELDAKARRLAAKQLTEIYNSVWNEYDEAQEDGTFKTVSHPKLTQQEFACKLALRAVNVTGNMLDFFYDNENMFWGHSVVVNSMDGVAFTDTDAQIFG